MIIGIDLGTTNSLVGIWKDNQVELIKNPMGSYLTPSVVGIDDDGTLLIGEAASQRLLTHPNLTAANFKRYMGTTRKFKLGDKEFLPEELSALVLKQLKQDVELYLGHEVNEAVISVPAYFNDIQRKATKNAAKLAGMSVERLINEPTAAGLAFGIEANNEQNQQFLVFDLGGGTFDVSILEVFDRVIEIKATTGDNFLGGVDFTEALAMKFIEKQQLNEKYSPEEMHEKIYPMVLCEAEKVKRGLTKYEKYEMAIHYKGEHHYLDIDLTLFETICEGLLERIKKPVNSAIRDARINVSEIERVLLVGGASRMTIIKSLIARLFGKFPLSHVNPDDAIVRGAVIQAGLKMRSKDLEEVVVTDVCPYTLGILSVKAAYLTNDLYQIFTPIIERNTVIPVSKVERFTTTVDNQSQVDVHIYQGESPEIENNIHLGKLSVEVPRNVAGKELIDVRFTYDINGLLEVEVIILSTKQAHKMVVKNNAKNLGPEELQERLKALDILKIHPRDQIENRTLCAKLEHLYAINHGNLRQYLGELLIHFKAVLDKQNPIEIKNEKIKIQEYLLKINESA